MVVGTKESDRTRASSQRSCEVQSVIMTPEVVTDELMFINNINCELRVMVCKECKYSLGCCMSCVRSVRNTSECMIVA